MASTLGIQNQWRRSSVSPSAATAPHAIVVLLLAQVWVLRVGAMARIEADSKSLVTSSEMKLEICPVLASLDLKYLL